MAIDWSQERRRLGVEPDNQVAIRLGVSREWVRRVRERFGIAPPPRDWHHWTKPQLRLLGKIPDGAIAARIGRSRVSVLRKRWSLGIPACRTAE